MSITWPILVYGSSLVLALLLVYFSRPNPWYWHAISVGLAFTLAFLPMRGESHGPGGDLLVGSLFTFLFFWGIGALVVPSRHQPRPKPPARLTRP